MKPMRYGFLLTLLLVGLGRELAATSYDQALTADSSISSNNHLEVASSAAPWINRIWVKDDANDLPGELLIFLANGTLVQTSCWEPYRLSNWETRSDAAVAWQEDTAEIEAHLEMIGSKELQVRLMLMGGDTLVEQYKEVDAPYVCPDMER